MKKIPTIFPKDPTDLGQVTDGVLMPGIEHFKIKIDGTACMIKDGKPFCRFDAKLFKRKKGKVIHYTMEEVISKLPHGAIACQKPDEKSGHFPHWIPVLDTDPGQKYILEGFLNLGDTLIDGTYECVGPKLQGNPHGEDKHLWIPHFNDKLKLFHLFRIHTENKPFEFLKDFLKDFKYEGLVAYDSNNLPIGKIRRSDFKYENNGYGKASELI